MKRNKILLYVTAILSLIGILIIYRDLPEQIPVHFSSQWEVDQYGHKSIAIIIGVGTIAVLALMEFVNIRNENMRKTKVYDIIEYTSVFLMIIMNWLTILIGKGYHLNAKISMSLVLGIALIIMGNYMPKIKQNFVVGIKTPWTLLNEVSWRKTHRVGGYIFILYGIMILVSAVVDVRVLYYLTGAILTIGIIFMFAYSYMIYRNEKKK